MPRYLISYDLTKDSADAYKALGEELTRLGAKRVLLSQWALRNAATAEQLRDHLWGYMDANDRVLVSDLSAGWASMRALTDINDI